MLESRTVSGAASIAAAHEPGLRPRGRGPISNIAALRRARHTRAGRSARAAGPLAPPRTLRHFFGQSSADLHASEDLHADRECLARGPSRFESTVPSIDAHGDSHEINLILPPQSPTTPDRDSCRGKCRRLDLGAESRERSGPRSTAGIHDGALRRSRSSQSGRAVHALSAHRHGRDCRVRRRLGQNITQRINRVSKMQFGLDPACRDLGR